MKQSCEHQVFDPNEYAPQCQGNDCFGPSCPAEGCIKGYKQPAPAPETVDQFFIPGLPLSKAEQDADLARIIERQERRHGL